ncbi:MAG: xanthine dehydrogenase family protein subunit M [Thermoanaerobaculia bacterium]|nr:xanthine dehydrogenase family protein subunit M [Thermoanaerobaculia bacterium]
MKPAPFEYHAPTSLAAALELLSQHGSDAKVLAGGQSLIPVLNFRLAQPALLVDLNRIPGLDGLTVRPDGSLVIGALVRQRQLERQTGVAAAAPLLAEAVPWIAHPQIRNRGTIGGSLAHADPAAELPAVMVALDARFRLASVRGERELPAADFFTGLFATALEPDELLVEITTPPLAPGSACAFLEVARRHGDYAQVGVNAVVTADEHGVCRAARLVFFSVGDGPVDAVEAGRLLVGQRLGPESFAAASEAVGRQLEPSGDIHASAAFKRHLARVLTRRVLETATSRLARRAA